MKISSAISACLFTAATVLAFLPAANATPVVITSGPTASAVDGIIVDGVDYDVTFTLYQNNTTFDGNAADATTAFNELLTALNSADTAFVNAGVVINHFIVQDNANGSGLDTTSFSVDGGWQAYTPSNSGDPVGAKFTAVAVSPEPSSLALFGTGILGVAGAIRRRIQHS